MNPQRGPLGARLAGSPYHPRRGGDLVRSRFLAARLDLPIPSTAVPIYKHILRSFKKALILGVPLSDCCRLVNGHMSAYVNPLGPPHSPKGSLVCRCFARYLFFEIRNVSLRATGFLEHSRPRGTEGRRVYTMAQTPALAEVRGACT